MAINITAPISTITFNTTGSGTFTLKRETSEYLYTNVGVNLDLTEEANEYLYTNVGVNLDLTEEANEYLYTNVETAPIYEGTWSRIRYHVLDLQDLFDVDPTGLGDGSLLQFDGVSQNWEIISPDTVGVTDHGFLTGLDDDDHPQYQTDSRHDSHDHSVAMATVELDDISNVSASGASSGEFLEFDGSNWISNEILASDVHIDTIGNTTRDTVQEYINIGASHGVLNGGDVVDNGDGTVNVSGGSVILRTADSEDSEVVIADFTSVTNQSLTDNAMNYIYVDYNAGSPQVVISVVNPGYNHTIVELATAYREGTDIHLNMYAIRYVANPTSHIISRFSGTRPIERESGAMISETGTRNIALSAGAFWQLLNRFSLPAIDTSTGDTFFYWWRDGIGGWTHSHGNTQINNTQYDDGSGTLATLSNNHYNVHWVYLETEGHLSVIYGTYNANNVADVEESTPPQNIPPHFNNDHAILVGKIIIQKNAASFYSIESPFVTRFSTGAGTTDHGSLLGLGDDDHTQYLNSSRHDTEDHSTAMSTVVINDISDVSVTGAASGTVLTFDGTDWVAGPGGGGGGGATDHGLLAGLDDDDHTQYLNTTRHDAHDHSTAMGTVVIDDISDVNISTVASGDLIRWDGSNWVNYPDSNYIKQSDHDKAAHDALNIDADTLDGLDSTAFSQTGHTHASTDVTDFAEAVSDQVGSMVTGNSETGISITYQDTDNTLDFTVSAEWVRDQVGAMVTGNTETGITVTYDDTNDVLNFDATHDHPEFLDSTDHSAEDHSAAMSTVILNDINDVSVTSAASGEVLTFDGTNWVPTAGGTGGESDHGALTGLADDDHTQYLNTARHDIEDHSTAMSTVVLNDISDVSVSAAASGEVLTFDGNDWVPAAGGSGGGLHTHDEYVETTGGGKSVARIATVSGSVTVDLADGNDHLLTVTGGVTGTTLTGWTADKLCAVTVQYIQDATGGHSITYPTGVTWISGQPPVAYTQANDITTAMFWSADGGTTIYGAVADDFNGDTLVETNVSGTYECNLADGNFFNLTVTADVTLSLAGGTSGDVSSMTVVATQDATGGWNVTWPTVTWIPGAPPDEDQAAGASTMVIFWTTDGGTTWFGSYGGGGGSTLGSAADIGDGTSTSIAYAHNLNTTDIMVAVYDISVSPAVQVFPDSVELTDANTVTVGFNTAPGTAERRLVIVGL